MWVLGLSGDLCISGKHRFRAVSLAGILVILFRYEAPSSADDMGWAR